MTIPLKNYRQVPVEPLRGKVVIDTNNYYPSATDTSPSSTRSRPRRRELLQAHLPESKVVKALQQHLLRLHRQPGPTGRRRRAQRARRSPATTTGPRRTVSAPSTRSASTRTTSGPLAEGWRFERDQPATAAPTSRTPTAPGRRRPASRRGRRRSARRWPRRRAPAPDRPPLLRLAVGCGDLDGAQDFVLRCSITGRAKPGRDPGGPTDTIGGSRRRRPDPKEHTVSDLKIVLAHADAREDRTVTTGTKAWELFADDTAVIAARGRTASSRTSPTSSPTATRSRAWRSTARTATTSCGTRPRT